MQMSAEEIRQQYREAKKPGEQIKILAQLNGTTPKKIKEILSDTVAWVDRPPAPPRRN